MPVNKNALLRYKIIDRSLGKRFLCRRASSVSPYHSAILPCWISGAKVLYPYAAFLRNGYYFSFFFENSCWQLKSHKHFQLVNIRTWQHSAKIIFCRISGYRFCKGKLWSGYKYSELATIWLQIWNMWKRKVPQIIDLQDSFLGASGWAWTNDPLINSQVL